MPANPKLTAKPALPERWLASLPKAERIIVESILRLAEDARLALYLVGGPLRDLLLRISPSLDADLAVEGDAIALAEAVAPPGEPSADGLRLKRHPTFGTASLIMGGFTVDIATARSETYERPGALPTVRPAAIEDDLRRRDFTVNAMALRLTGPARGEIIDPFGGRADLETGLIRILHERSLRDDATRILRAARYEARFTFRIEEQTLAALQRDLSCLRAISGARLHHEFARIFAEWRPERALVRLDELGVLGAIHPGLGFSEEQAEAFSRLREMHRSGAAGAGWALLAWPLSGDQAAAVAARLALTKPQREAVVAMPRLRAIGTALAPPRLKPSQLAEQLAPFPPAAVWAFAAASPPPLGDRLLDYLRRLRHLKPRLTGGDLIRMGIAPGPRLGEVLARLRAAKLDGEVRTKRDEIRFAESAIRAPHLPAHPEAFVG